MSQPLLEVKNLTVQYRTSKGAVTAVSDASFVIDDNTYFGIVGESGCGKSTMAKALIGGLDSNGYIESGEIYYRGQPLHEMTEEELRQEIRWKEISYIPQGSMNSLDPLQRISDTAVEIGQTHTDMSREEAIDKLRGMFEIVGIDTDRIFDYPHQFSGGMQQRAIIALALYLEPSLIIADEPTTALDVIMQDQIFKYLDEIHDSTDTSMVMITHDISLIFESCDELAIMHGGQIAETGSVTRLYDSPRHPYSILLQEAFPDHRYPDRELKIIEGSPPELIGEVDFCTFADRCPWAEDECRKQAPQLEDVSAEDKRTHRVACMRKDAVAADREQTQQADEIVGDQ